jgi:branched-chain amino acid transport system substrate-binding protein
MKRTKWWTVLSMLLALMLVTAACARDEDGGGGGGGGQATCPDDEFGCVEVGPDDPIQLGTLLVITGPNSSLGLDSQHGVEIALDMRGQVMGHDVEMVNEDDGCAAEGGQAGAQALVTNPDIVAVIGTSCSSAAVPASEILSDKGILLISPSNTSPTLTNPDQDYFPFYARTAHNDLVQGAAMAQFVAEKEKAKSAATVHDGSPYAEGLANAFANWFETQYNGQIVEQEAVQVGQKDFKPVLTSIAAKHPDFIYYPVFIPEGAGLTQQAREVPGLSNTGLAGADGMLSPDFIDAAGDASEGMFLSGPDLSFKNEKYQNEFLPAYKEKFGQPSAPFHAHAFDATNIVLDAIEEVAVETDDGGLLIPHTQLKDAVYDTSDYQGLIGTLSCNEYGDCNPETTIAVNEVKNGDFDPIFSATLTLEEVSPE